MLNLLTKENVTIYQQRGPETLTGFFSKQRFSMSSLQRFTTQPILEPYERLLYQNLRKTFHILKMQITKNLQNVVKTGFVETRHKWEPVVLLWADEGIVRLSIRCPTSLISQTRTIHSMKEICL